ncbi:MAG: cell division protein FtsZ [Bacteroidales bacterium]|nr:cell division protein FtsZ [Bacteroidales bacterium]
MEEDAIFTFDSPKGQSSYIKVIGVGGGGGNAVNHMFRQGIKGVDFIVCNTDMKALNSSPVPNKITLGDLGLGAGNKPERARQAAQDKADDIRDAISHNTQMLFITAGMGGGTGTGAAPVIAEIAKSIDLDNDENKKILVVAIVTLPFGFEGRRRSEQAMAGIKELSQHVDSIIVINNDKLRTYGNLPMSKAFAMADDVLLTAAKSIAEIITNNAYINIDFQDVNTVMEHSGTALMGAGAGAGENRAIEAITAATTSVLLNDNDIRGAKNVLLYFSYSSEHELTMDEQTEITDFIIERTGNDADFIWGAGIDDDLGDELKVILIATGFEKTTVVPQEPKVIELPKDEPKVETVAVAKVQPAPAAATEPVIIHKDEPAPQPVMDVFKPIEKIAPKPAPAPEPVKHVIMLEDDEPVAAVPVVKTPATRTDVMVEDIHLVDTLEPAPAAKAEPVKPAPQPAPQPAMQVNPNPARSAFENDNDVKTAAERIAYIHNLLRNNANGADIVQRMPATTYAEGELYEGRPSNSREASSYTMRADGIVTKNAFYDDQPD